MKSHKQETIFYICNDFERALGLETTLDNFHIICIDKNQGHTFARAQGAKIFCLEEELGQVNPILRNSSRLLQTPQVQQYVKNNTPQGTTPNVMFFKIADSIEQVCKELGYHILNTTAELNQMFELKISQYNKLAQADVNFPKTLIGKLNQYTFNEISKAVSFPFVIQYNRGHTGSGTVFINNLADFHKELVKYPNRMARYTTKIEGEAWTLNACVTRCGIAYGGLSYQITGIKECTSKLGGTVGNDWSLTSKLSHDTLKQIESITLHAGLAMQKEGYKGLYGLDFVIDKSGQVYLIEINARQPASTSMHTKLMLHESKIPLQVFHIAEFLFSEDENEEYLKFLNEILIKNSEKHNKPIKQIGSNNIDMIVKQQNESELLPKQAAQLIIRNTSKKEIVTKLAIKTGIYSFDLKTENLKFEKEGYSIDEITNKDQFLILACENGRIVSSEIEIARIQSLESLLLPTTQTPSEEIIKIVKQINGRKN